MPLSEITQSKTETFAQKLKHLVRFGEFLDGKWCYRFASHPRFGYWAYNILYRKRLLSQGNFYIKQNPKDKLLSIDEMQEMLESGTFKQAVSKLLHYAKNVSGTNAYWNQVKEQLKATISQVGPPTIYWTLSCAEYHWPEFHSLFDETGLFDSNKRRHNIVNNPHILDWFFTERTESFVKNWLYESLGRHGIGLGMNSQFCAVQYTVMDWPS